MLTSRSLYTMIIQNICSFVVTACFYEFLALPFGLSSAPRIFTKIIKPVIAYLRDRVIRLVIFLDDIAVLGGSVQECQTDVNKVIDLLGKMGFIINHGKSNLTPRQIASDIGYVIGTSSTRRSLSLEKISKISDSARAILSFGTSGVTELLGALRRFSFGGPRHPPQYRHIFQEFNLNCLYRFIGGPLGVALTLTIVR